MPNNNEIEIDATMANLEKALATIREVMENASVAPGIATKVEICAEEIYTNVADYAYEGGVGTVKVSAYVDGDPLAIHVRFEDAGSKYNPLEKPDPDITASVEERPIGGLGVYMTKKMMDSCSYEYKDGKNIFLFEKNL